MPEWSEILVILVVAMVVFGPHRLPAMARKAGKMMAEFRAAARELREGIERELAVEEMREVAKEVVDATREAGQEARKSLAESDRALRTPPALARPGDTAPGAARDEQAAENPDENPESDSTSVARPSDDSRSQGEAPDHPS